MSRRRTKKCEHPQRVSAPDVWKFSQGHGGRGESGFGKGDYEAYRAALQQGKPPAKQRKLRGQLAVIHQKVRDYTVKLKALLANPKTTISAGRNDRINRSKKRCSKLSAMANERLGKDAAIQQLARFRNG